MPVPAPTTPASPAEEACLPVVTCPICHEECITSARMVPCHHEYCYPCIAKWCGQNPTCPVCREPILTLVVSNDTYHTLEDLPAFSFGVGGRGGEEEDEDSGDEDSNYSDEVLHHDNSYWEQDASEEAMEEQAWRNRMRRIDDAQFIVIDGEDEEEDGDDGDEDGEGEEEEEEEEEGSERVADRPRAAAPLDLIFAVESQNVETRGTVEAVPARCTYSLHNKILHMEARVVCNEKISPQAFHHLLANMMVMRHAAATGTVSTVQCYNTQPGSPVFVSPGQFAPQSEEDSTVPSTAPITPPPAAVPSSPPPAPRRDGAPPNHHYSITMENPRRESVEVFPGRFSAEHRPSPPRSNRRTPSRGVNTRSDRASRMSRVARRTRSLNASPYREPPSVSAMHVPRRRDSSRRSPRLASLRSHPASSQGAPRRSRSRAE